MPNDPLPNTPGNDAEASNDPAEKYTRGWWIVIGVLVFIGAAFRIGRNLMGYPLRIDEIRVAENIRSRGFLDLALPLDHEQAAPFGFLWMSKLSSLIFGDVDFAYRLVPLLAGIAALVLIPFIARRVVGRAATVFVTALVAVSPWGVQYSSDFKQYSTDTFFSAAVLLAALHLLQNKTTWRARLVYALIGSVAIFCSHPAMFVTAGTGLTLGILALRRKDTPAIKQLLATAGFWVLSFAVLWIVNLRHVQGADHMQSYWAADFMPLPPRSAVEWKWFIRTFFEWFNTVGYYFNPILMLLIALGLVSLYLRKPVTLILLGSLTIVTLIANVAQAYPFANRMVYFLMPATVMFAAAGFDDVVRYVRPWVRRIGRCEPEDAKASAIHRLLPLSAEIAGVWLVGVLFMFTLPFTQIKQPWMGGRFDLKILMQHADAVEQYDADAVVNEVGMWWPYMWYTEELANLPAAEAENFYSISLPREPGDKYTDELLAALEGYERVWVFAADDIWMGRDPDTPYLSITHNTRAATVAVLEAHGQIVDQIHGYNASGYLVDLTLPPTTDGYREDWKPEAE